MLVIFFNKNFRSSSPKNVSSALRVEKLRDTILDETAHPILLLPISVAFFTYWMSTETSAHFHLVETATRLFSFMFRHSEAGSIANLIKDFRTVLSDFRMKNVYRITFNKYTVLPTSINYVSPWRTYSLNFNAGPCANIWGPGLRLINIGSLEVTTSTKVEYLGFTVLHSSA